MIAVPRPVRLLPGLMVLVAGVSMIVGWVGGPATGGDGEAALLGFALAAYAVIDRDGLEGRLRWAVVGAGMFAGVVFLLSAMF